MTSALLKRVDIDTALWTAREIAKTEGKPVKEVVDDALLIYRSLPIGFRDLVAAIAREGDHAFLEQLTEELSALTERSTPKCKNLPEMDLIERELTELFDLDRIANVTNFINSISAVWQHGHPAAKGSLRSGRPKPQSCRRQSLDAAPARQAPR